MLRIKIINELEAPHRQQIENKKLEIDHLKNEIYKFKRELDLSKTEVESVKTEAKMEIMDIQERQKEHVNELNKQMEVLKDFRENDQLK